MTDWTRAADENMALLPHDGGTPPPSFTMPPAVRTALFELAIALNYALEPEQAAIYARALHDIDVQDFRAACLSLGATETFWPKPIDIRQRAVRLARERAARATPALPPPADEPTYRCAKCWDNPSGWQVIRHCPEVPCERTKPHPAHTFTVRCSCWLLRNAARLDLRRQEALQKGWSVPADCDALAEVRDGRYRWEKPW